MKRIETIINKLKESMNDISIDFAYDYYDTDRDINDAISQECDYKVDIYTSDLMEWASNNVSVIDDSIQEFGINNNMGILDIIRQAQYMDNERQIRDDASNMLALCALLHLKNIDENIDNDGIYFILANLRNDIDTFCQLKEDVQELSDMYDNEDYEDYEDDEE